MRKAPLYQQICESLSHEIVSKGLRPHDFFTTSEEICQRFETSRITAQRVIMELVKSGVIYAKRGCGAYIAEPVRSTQSRLVSVLFSHIYKEGALPLIVHGAETSAREHGYGLLMANNLGDLAVCRQCVEQMLEQNVAGVLYDIPSTESPEGSFEEVVHQFEARGIPVVLVQKRFMRETLPTAYVVSDNYGGSFKAVEHLCQLGHRRIAGIFETSSTGALERLEGYRGAVLKYGADYHPDYAQTLSRLDECQPLVEKLLAMTPPPTAIFCCHDLVAREVMQLLHGRGLRVPQDVALIGFDDLPFSRYLNPPLSTVRQPLEEIGREAMRILLGRINGDFNDRPQVRMETELVVRASTRPVAD